MNEVPDLRLLSGLCKKMLVVPELVGSESLFVNEIVRWIDLSYFRCSGACEKRDGRYGVSDYHAGIYFFFCLRCYPQFESRGSYLGKIVRVGEKILSCFNRNRQEFCSLESIYLHSSSAWSSGGPGSPTKFHSIKNKSPNIRGKDWCVS